MLFTAPSLAYQLKHQISVLMHIDFEINDYYFHALKPVANVSNWYTHSSIIRIASHFTEYLFYGDDIAFGPVLFDMTKGHF